MQQARRSKLETYVDILKVLALNGPLMQTNIMSKGNPNRNVLKDHLSFLIKNDLVEERISKSKPVFAVTQNGITVLKYFRELKQKSPLVE